MSIWDIPPKKFFISPKGSSVVIDKSAKKMLITKTARNSSVTFKFLELVITHMV